MQDTSENLPALVKMIEEGRSLYTPEEQRIFEQLYSEGPVGRAFKKICNAGVEPAILERSLMSLTGYAMTRRHPTWPTRELQRLDRIGRTLSTMSIQLEPFLLLMSFRPDWPIKPLQVPAVLKDLSVCIRATAVSKFAKKWPVLTAYTEIPRVVFLVRKVTGRPHFAELATLIGAIYKMPSLSAANLKTIEGRGPRRFKR